MADIPYNDYKSNTLRWLRMESIEKFHRGLYMNGYFQIRNNEQQNMALHACRSIVCQVFISNFLLELVRFYLKVKEPFWTMVWVESFYNKGYEVLLSPLLFFSALFCPALPCPALLSFARYFCFPVLSIYCICATLYTNTINFVANRFTCIKIMRVPWYSVTLQISIFCSKLLIRVVLIKIKTNLSTLVKHSKYLHFTRFVQIWIWPERHSLYVKHRQK